MKKENLNNLLALLAVLIIQISFFPALFSLRPVPNLLLFLVVAWTLINGFEKMFWWIIFAGITFDLATYQKVGFAVIFFIIASYIVSFYSRRLSVEHRLWGNMVVAGFIFLLTVLSRLYGLFLAFIEKNISAVSLPVLHNLILQNLPTEVILNIIIFFAFFAIMKKFEKKSASLG